MSIEIGRQAYLGFAIEDTSGSAESSPDTFLPTLDLTVEEKHEPLMDTSTRSSRIMNHDAQEGRKWGEGDVGMYLDSLQSGYLLRAAFGNENKVNVVSGVDEHEFYVTASGNAPETATLWLYRGSGPSVKQFTYAAVDSLSMEITNDGLATLTASLMSKDPSSVSAPTLTTTSGTVYNWGDTSLYFGTSVSDATGNTATKITNFQFELNNNIETIYRSGSRSPDALTMGTAEVTGEYTLFFEDDTELDKYMNTTKKTLVLEATGNGINGSTERFRFTAHDVVIEDKSIESGQDDFYAITQTFRALNNKPEGFVTTKLRNTKTSEYNA